MLKMIRTDFPFDCDRLTITERIGEFWDQISKPWQDIWGEHIHHGFYESNAMISPADAQIKLIQKLTELLTIKPHDHILDVGCGMGGSSRYLAKKFGAKVTGVTLSAKQVEIASQQVQAENIKEVDFKLDDALVLKNIPDHSIDIVWSLESCEQFYDKKIFFQQVFRVLKPGGKFMLATWCSDQDEYVSKAAKSYQKLCKAFDLPYMPSMAYYKKLFALQNLTLDYAEDWSERVKRSWEIGLSLLNKYTFFKILKMGGWRGLRFANQIKLMKHGFQTGKVKYGVFVAHK